MIFVLAAIMMVACTQVNAGRKSYSTSEDIYVIDSCEYICTSVYIGAVYTHKGNCKFCAERHRKELYDLIKQLNK